VCSGVLADADRLVTMMEGAALTTYTYTGYGALASEALGKGTTAYSYNGQDQLTGVTAPDGTRSTYTFDGDGMRRAAQEGNVQPTTFVWDGSDYLLLNEPTGNRVVLTLESEIVACGTRDLLTDPLGSLVREIASGASLGSLVEMYPYGTLVKDTGAVTTPFVFVAAYGYYTDSSSRDYVRARELMKSIGRWLQVDPLWPDEMAYAYAYSSPTDVADYSGERPSVACIPCASCLIALGLNCYDEPDFYKCVEEILNHSGWVGEACRVICGGCLTKGRGKPRGTAKPRIQPPPKPNRGGGGRRRDGGGGVRGSGPWICYARCTLRGPSPPCGSMVTGKGFGSSEEQACRAAKRAAVHNVQPGLRQCCTIGHCYCPACHKGAK